MKRIRTTMLLALVVAGGCRSVTDCDLAYVPAIQLTVVDAQSKEFIGRQVIVIAALRGGETDTIASPAGSTDISPIWVGDSPGIYDLVVRRFGYAELALPNLRVDQGDGCHPATRDVQASLQPLQ